MKKKDLDVLQIMRESIIKANTDLGFIKKTLNEQTQESAFRTEFDVERDMPSFKITNDWGTRGTTDANEIDAVIKSIVDVSEKNGLKRYKKSLQKLNEVVGGTIAAEGELPTPAEETQLNLGEIVSSLQLKNLIHTIIAKQDPSASGKIYESLMARIAGGFTPSGFERGSIQDFTDAEGNFISLKTIGSQDSDIKGSKLNLARGIAKKGKVIYLVNVKDAEDNPFRMTPFSFVIDKENFFYFITGGADRQKINDEIDSLNAKFFKQKEEIAKKGAEQRKAFEKRKEKLAGQPEEKPTKEQPEQTTGIEESLLNEKKESKFDVFEKINNDPEKAVQIYKKLFPKELDADLESVRRKFRGTFVDLEKVLKQNKMAEKLLDNSYRLANGIQIDPAELVGSIFVGEKSKKIYKRDGLSRLIKAVNYTDELNGLQLGMNAETDEKLTQEYETLAFQPRTLSDEKVNDIRKEFENRNKDYVNARQTLHKALMPFYTFYNAFLDTYEKPESVAPEMPIEKSGKVSLMQSLANQGAYQVAVDTSGKGMSGQALADKVTKFWQDLASSQVAAENLSENVEKETQFSLSIAQVKKVAKETASGQLDESYPTIVVTYQALEQSATKSAELFKQWARPVFEGLHYLKQGINRYFVEDSVEGLSVAQDGIEKVDSQITKLSETGLKATELKENKQSFKEYLKKSPLDDILEEILK